MVNTFLFIAAFITYTTPYLYPSTGVFIFLMPLFLFHFIRLTHSRALLLVWALCIGVAHSMACAYALYVMATGPLHLKLILPSMCILYVVASSACWLLCTHALLKRITRENLQLIVWFVSLYAYLLYIDTTVLWPCGRREGLSLLNPLMCIIAMPFCTEPVFTFLIRGDIFLFCVIATTLTGITMIRNTWFALTSYGCICAILLLMYLQQPSSATLFIPSWVETIGHLPVAIPASWSPEKASLMIHHELMQLHTTYPQLDTVIIPESAYLSDQLTTKNTLPLLEHHPIKSLIIGSLRKEVEYYNSLYYFHRGKRVFHADKCHALPWLERLMPYYKDLCYSLFFSTSPPIKPSATRKSLWFLMDIGSIVPYICSELFCNNDPIDDFTVPILAVCSDVWFPSFIQRLMSQRARLKACQWQRTIIYISYHYAHVYMPSGATIPLITCICQDGSKNKNH